MAGATFTPNPFFEVELTEELQQPGGPIETVAETVAAGAQAIAPVVTGEYQASIHAELIDGHWTAVADVDYAAPVEWGTYKDPAQHVMTRGAEASGFAL